MKAVIYLDVPAYQIGQPVHVFFKDTMEKHGVCEAEQEIVRCKDCKFMYEDDVFQCGIKAGYFPVHEDWFCADGERKDVNNG